ncbi:hypothetical protein [Salana multivorans]
MAGVVGVLIVSRASCRGAVLDVRGVAVVVAVAAGLMVLAVSVVTGGVVVTRVIHRAVSRMPGMAGVLLGFVVWVRVHVGFVFLARWWLFVAGCSPSGMCADAVGGR